VNLFQPDDGNIFPVFLLAAFGKVEINFAAAAQYFGNT